MEINQEFLDKWEFVAARQVGRHLLAVVELSYGRGRITRTTGRGPGTYDMSY